MLSSHTERAGLDGVDGPWHRVEVLCVVVDHEVDHLVEACLDADVPRHRMRGDHRQVQREPVGQWLQSQRDVTKLGPAQTLGWEGAGCHVECALRQEGGRGKSTAALAARAVGGSKGVGSGDAHCAEVLPPIRSRSHAHSTGPPEAAAIRDIVL